MKTSHVLIIAAGAAGAGYWLWRRSRKPAAQAPVGPPSLVRPTLPVAPQQVVKVPLLPSEPLPMVKNREPLPVVKTPLPEPAPVPRQTLLPRIIEPDPIPSYEAPKAVAPVAPIYVEPKTPLPSYVAPVMPSAPAPVYVEPEPAPVPIYRAPLLPLPSFEAPVVAPPAPIYVEPPSARSAPVMPAAPAQVYVEPEPAPVQIFREPIQEYIPTPMPEAPMNLAPVVEPVPVLPERKVLVAQPVVSTFPDPAPVYDRVPDAVERVYTTPPPPPEPVYIPREPPPPAPVIQVQPTVTVSQTLVAEKPASIYPERTLEEDYLTQRTDATVTSTALVTKPLVERTAAILSGPRKAPRVRRYVDSRISQFPSRRITRTRVY